MADILPHTNGSSLILFNVSDTLYEPSVVLADNQWRLYFAKLVAKTIPTPSIADGFINKIKNLIVKKIPKKAVEIFTVRLIADLQQEQEPVLGITRKNMTTAYAENFGEITHDHLISIGIDLEKTLNYLPISEKRDDNSHQFDFGIIFTNKQPEGPALLSFLKRLKWMPKKIIMIDNSRESLENVETALQPTGIKFIGMRYGRCDGRHQNFDPDIGTIQFLEYLKGGRVLSDAEAKHIKHHTPHIRYETLLEDYIRSNAGKP